MKFDANYYRLLTEHAKDTAVIFGIDSKQYLDTVDEMQFYYKNTKKSLLFKVINLIAHIKWLMKKQA